MRRSDGRCQLYNRFCREGSVPWRTAVWRIYFMENAIHEYVAQLTTGISVNAKLTSTGPWRKHGEEGEKAVGIELGIGSNEFALVQWVIKEKHLLRMLSDKRRWKICWDHSSMETRRERGREGGGRRGRVERASERKREVVEAGTRWSDRLS